MNEANTLYRAALELRPVEHPDRASSLHDIAQCLADRSRQKSAATDLDEVIAAEQEALQLLERGNPGFDVSQRCLADHVLMKTRIPAAMAFSDALRCHQVRH